jgi:hypothetical protein
MIFLPLAPLMLTTLTPRPSHDSDTTTTLGGPSRIMSLLSNVRQDWQGVFYLLAGAYPSLLSAAPITATATLVAVVAAWTAREHAPPSGEIEEKRFQFRGFECTIRTDYSAIWDSGSRASIEYPMQMLDRFKGYIEGLGPGDAQLLNEIRTLIAATNVHAVIWRRLLWAGVEHPLTLGLQLREMLWQVSVLTSLDTTEAAAALIAAIFASLSNEERARIEQSILTISPYVHADGRLDYQTRDRLLGSVSSLNHLLPTW